MQKLIVGTIFFLLVALIIYLYMEINNMRMWMLSRSVQEEEEAPQEEAPKPEVEGDGLE